MSVALLVTLALVGASGTLVVLSRNTVHQAIVFGLFGLLLALGFLLLEAPDAALAQIIVSGLIVPLLVVIVLAELREGAE